MANPKNVQHTIRGFWMSRAYAEQVMREHCTITWDDVGGVRDTTEQERIELRAEQQKAAVPVADVPQHEIPHTRFKGPIPNARGLIRAGSWILEQRVISRYMQETA